MSPDVLLLIRSLDDRRRSLTVWCAGAAAYIAMIAAVFPSISGSPAIDKLVHQYPDVLKSMLGGSLNLSSGPGYMDAELFSLMLPLFALAMAIGTGAGTLAGEQEQGLLDTLLSYPVSRRQLLLGKAGALLLELAALCAAMLAGMLLAGAAFDMHLGLGRTAAAVTALGLLGVLHGWMALAVGAATRHRASAIGVPAGLAAAAYLIATLHTLASWLKPFRYASSFYYAGQAPLQRGVDLVDLGVLAAEALVVLSVAVVVFDRRDLASQ
jgi:ABC-2 type transport system permease protein